MEVKKWQRKKEEKSKLGPLVLQEKDVRERKAKHLALA